MSDESDADPELITAPLLSSKKQINSHLISDDASTTSMASVLAPLGDGLLPCGDVHGKSGGVTMRARETTPLRESLRQVQPVPRMWKTLDMERKSKQMGRPCAKPKQAAAALTVLLHNGNFIRGPEVHTSTDYGTGFTIQPVDAFTEYPVLSEGGQEPWRQTKNLPNKEDREEKAERRRDVGRVRVGSGQSLSHYEIEECEAPEELYLDMDTMDEFGLSQMNPKKGRAVWLAGHLKHQRKIYEKEINVYKALATHSTYVAEGSKADVMALDLVEVFAGKARVTDLASRYGLSASQPFDLKYGIDLKSSEGQELLRKAVIKLRPLLLLVAWPCTVWNLFNKNLNYAHRLEELEVLREDERPLVRLGAELCYEQISAGRFFLGENPVRSDLWKEDEVQSLRQHADTIEVICDAGAYGAENRDGWPIQKPHRWITNCSEIAENLSCRMTPEQKMYTKPIEGKDTKPSGEYCDGIANAILVGLQKAARMRNPQRFQTEEKAAKVFYARPAEDEEAWRQLLDEAERRFANTHKRPFILGQNDEMMAKIKQLVPWEITRVQLAWTPAARRWPTDVSFSHRGCALRTMPGAFRLEHDDEDSVRHPLQRFAESIRVGIFFYGYAEEDEADVIPPDEPDLPPQADVPKKVTGVTTDIYFEGGPPMSREMQASVARLHCNLGHPPKQEIVRILAAAGKLDSKILAALDALRCGSCLRMSKTIKPTTSSTSSTVKYSGAFGDHLQTDIIFVRLLSGEACPVLGIVCLSTNFHAAKVLDNRTPEHVLSSMIEVWYRPFGLPISITVDADTCFLGKNQAWHQNLGIEYDIAPTEEAWRLGKVGKRNALMRTLAERLIDQNAVVDRRHLDEVLIAVLFSMNSSTYSYGRSPYQAVFGRVPRPVGDILSDNKALSISAQLHPEQHAVRPELLRAEAITALAQFTASQAVKRALLRKTRNQNDLSHLLPGQTVAFWRMSGKSRQHKKGSWNLARFLAFDPDKKSCWLQVGKTSMRVGTTQLRPATGWENWTPSDSDIKMIRQAENNIAAGLWLEDGAEGPDLEDEMNVDEELFQFKPTKMPRLEERDGSQQPRQQPLELELDPAQHPHDSSPQFPEDTLSPQQRPAHETTP